MGGSKSSLFSDNSQGGCIQLSKVSRGIIPFDIKHCGSRDYQRQHIIKEKNSRWGFIVIKQVGDLAWSQIHLDFLCSHGPGYRALNNSQSVHKSVGVVHASNEQIFINAYIKQTTTQNTKASKEVICIQEHKRRKGNPIKEWVMIKNAHRLKWPNSLKTIPSRVANCCNLPFGGRATRSSQERLPRKENAWSLYQRLFEEKIRKTQKRPTNFENKKVRESFTCRECISTPCVRHKEWQPLIKCAKSWLQIYFIFSFFTFFIFFGSTRAGLLILHILNCNEEFRST